MRTGLEQSLQRLRFDLDPEIGGMFCGSPLAMRVPHRHDCAIVLFYGLVSDKLTPSHTTGTNQPIGAAKGALLAAAARFIGPRRVPSRTGRACVTIRLGTVIIRNDTGTP